MNRLLLGILLCVLVLSACSSVVVKRGDYVFVTYTGQFQNGTVFDTNDIKHRDLFPQYPPNRFTSMPILVGQHQVVPGFENALFGMKKGETKRVTIKAKDAYGGYDPGNELKVPKRVIFLREQSYKRVITTTLDQLPQGISLGSTFNSTNFEYKVVSMNATHAAISILQPHAQTVTLEGNPWNSTLITSESDRVVFRHNVEENAMYDTTYGEYIAHLNETHVTLETTLQVGHTYQARGMIARATRETTDSIIVDFNPPLAGLDLTFDITVNDIQEQK